jgi:hypothetical protein
MGKGPSTGRQGSVGNRLRVRPADEDATGFGKVVARGRTCTGDLQVMGLTRWLLLPDPAE